MPESDPIMVKNVVLAIDGAERAVDVVAAARAVAPHASLTLVNVYP
jgi:hypothetical protein